MSILGVWEAHRDFASMRYQLLVTCMEARGCTGSRSRQGAPEISVPGMWFRGDRARETLQEICQLVTFS
jgi:hypothetical protein